MMVIFMVVIMLLLIFFLVQMTLTSKSEVSDPQLTSIESGFEALRYSVLMSASFFLLSVLFVLFDMELVLLLPFIFSFQLNNIITMTTFYIMMIFISVSLLWEWAYHGLKWSS